MTSAVAKLFNHFMASILEDAKEPQSITEILFRELNNFETAEVIKSCIFSWIWENHLLCETFVVLSFV